MALLKETTVTTSQNGYSLILRTYEDAVNKAANTSTVRIELLLKSNSVRFVDYGCLGELWLNGALAYSNEAQYSFPSLGSTITIASWTTSVEHNSDGTRSITVSAWFKCASGAYTAGSAEVTNGSMALTADRPHAVCAHGGDGKSPGATARTIPAARSISRGAVRRERSRAMKCSTRCERRAAARGARGRR